MLGVYLPEPMDSMCGHAMFTWFLRRVFCYIDVVVRGGAGRGVCCVCKVREERRPGQSVYWFRVWPSSALWRGERGGCRKKEADVSAAKAKAKAKGKNGCCVSKLKLMQKVGGAQGGVSAALHYTGRTAPR